MFSLEFSGELNIYFVGLDNTIHAFSINQIRSGKHYSSFLFSVQTNKGGCIFLFMFIAIASYGWDFTSIPTTSFLTRVSLSETISLSSAMSCRSSGRLSLFLNLSSVPSNLWDKEKKRHKTINIHPQSRLKQNYTYLKIKQHVNAQFDPTNCVRFFHILNMWHQTLAGKDSKQEHLIWHFIVYVYKMEAFKSWEN